MHFVIAFRSFFNRKGYSFINATGLLDETLAQAYQSETRTARLVEGPPFWPSCSSA